MTRRLPLLALVAPMLIAADGIPLVAIGLPFAPVSPTPIKPGHPMFRDVAVGEIENLPATVKSSSLNFIAAAKRSSINAGLRDTLDRMNLLAARPGGGHRQLTASWIGTRTPFRIGTSNRTTVTIRYRLQDIATRQLLLDREITTSAEGGGADASMRDNGIVRAAIAANFASIAYCLDAAGTSAAPADCALTPRFSVSVTRTMR